jgi:glucose/mannose transport system permease protein
VTGDRAARAGRPRGRGKGRGLAVHVLLAGPLVLAAAFYLLPFYMLVVTSMKSFAEVSLAQMWALPSSLSFSSFVQAWQGNPAHGLRGLNANFLNSVKLTVPATVLSAWLGSMNGYVLAKWRFRGADVVFPAILFGMFIPYQSILIPLVQTLQRMGLYGTLQGLIFVHVVYGIPITTLIFRNYYATVPNELVEAGTMDGAGIWGIYQRIIVPLSPPALVVAAIWQFTSIWNDFLFGVTVTSQPSVQPITVALNNLAGSFVVEWNVQMGGALLAALPTLVVYVLLGRYFMRGLMAGSLKG